MSSRTLSVDLRKRVVAAMEAGASSREAAKRFGVAVSSAVKWYQRYRMTGSVEPLMRGGYRPRLLEAHRSFIHEQLKATPHLTLSGLQALLAERDVHVCLDTVWRFVRSEGLSFKKNGFCP